MEIEDLYNFKFESMTELDKRELHRLQQDTKLKWQHFWVRIMHKHGFSNKEIADRLGIGESRILAWMRPRPEKPASPWTASPTKIKFETNEELQEMLRRARLVIQEFGTLTIADFKVMWNGTSEPADDRWGWDSLVGWQFETQEDGIIVTLPEAEPLRNKENNGY